MHDLRTKVIQMYISTLSLKKYYQTKQITAITNFNKANPPLEITFKDILETTHPSIIAHIPPKIDLNITLPFDIGSFLYQLYKENCSLYDILFSSYKTVDFFTFVSLDPSQKNIPIYRFGGFETNSKLILYLQGYDGKERRLSIHMNTFLADFREVL